MSFLSPIDPDILKEPVLLGYNFDTLKASGDLSSFSMADFHLFNALISHLIQIKKNVQDHTIGASSNRYLEYLTNTNIPYKIYAQAVTGFSVSLATSEFTIFLRKINKLTHEAGEKQIHIKVEFRAQALWSYGLDSCIKKFNCFFDDLLITSLTQYKNIPLKLQAGENETPSFIIRRSAPLETFISPYFSFTKSQTTLSSFLVVSEVHLALDTQGYNFKKADSYRFKTVLSQRRFYGDVTETLYLGSTSSSQQFRIYNKTVLEDKTGDNFFEKLYDHHGILDHTMPIWRLEMQLRGKFLKDRGIVVPLNLSSSLDFMQSIISIFFASISFRIPPRSFILNRLCDVYVPRLQQSRILEESSIFPFWEKIQNDILKIEPTRFKIVDKTKTKKIKYVSNALKALLSTSFSVTGTALGASELRDVLEYANEIHKQSHFNSDGEGMSIFESFYLKHKQFDIDDINCVGDLGFWKFLEKNLDWKNKEISKNSLAKAIEFFHPRKKSVEVELVFCDNIFDHDRDLKSLAREFGFED
jgi:hypothetical protein